MEFPDFQKESKHESKLGSIAGIIGAIAVVLIGIISAHNFFPPTIFYSLISILILAMVVFVFYISSLPFIRYIQKHSIIRKQKKLIQQIHEEFKYYVEKFEEFVNVNGRHNIATVLYDLGVIDDPYDKNVITFTDKLIDKSIFSSLCNLYKSFSIKINYKKMGIENFKFIVKEFDAILELYSRLIWRSVEKIKKLSKGRNVSDSKENYKECREVYISYVKEYISFSEKMNKKFGEKFFRAYFDLPKEL